MSQYLTWGALSALLIVVSGVPYMWGIYRRTVPRPVLSAWGMWAVLGGLILLAYYDVGARMDTTLPAAWLGFINPIIILILALRYGKRTWSKLETVCVIVFVLTVVAWKTFESPVVGLAGGLIADAMGAIPQIRHNWRRPQDEPWFPWTMFCIASGVNLLSVEKWEFGYYLYPVYMTIGSALIVSPVLLYHYRLWTGKIQSKTITEP